MRSQFPRSTSRITRDRLRQIKPRRAGKVLSHDRYWTVPFLRLYLERCDALLLDQPEKAYLLAQQAPELARRIRINAADPEMYRDAAEKSSFRVLALSHFGSACRATSRGFQLDAAFEEARALCEELRVDPEARGELLRREALVLIARNDPKTPELLQDSYALYESIGHRNGMADCCIALGKWALGQNDHSSALQRYSQAISLADADFERGQRTRLAGIHNLAYVLTTSAPSLSALQEAGRLLKLVRQELAPKASSHFKMKVMWAEGLLAGKLGVLRYAERLLDRARRGFQKLEDYLNYALASIDLASLVRLDDKERALQIIAETSQLLAEIDRPEVSKWLAEFSLRSSAISTELFDEVKQKIYAMQAEEAGTT